MKRLCKIVFPGIFAALGAAAGLVFFLSLMIVEVEGSTMLPDLEPGDRVLVLRSILPYEEAVPEPGDLVLYEAPYYTAGGEGRYLIRRVTGMQGSWLRLNCDVKTVTRREILARREDISGKVILKLPEKIF